MKKFLTLFTALFLMGSMMVVHAVTYTPAGTPASVFTNEWTPNTPANDMVLSNGLYVFAKKDNFASQTSISFKVCKDHGWSTAYPGSNYGFNIPAGSKYLIITYNTSGNAVNAFAISSMTVAGDNATLFGSTWTPSATANDMTLQNDGTYKFEKTGVALSAGAVSFKACANHAWTNAWPSDNYSLSIPESGNYTITITFNPATLSVSATADLEQAVVVIPNIQLHSNIKNPSWETTANFDIAGNEETASLTLTNVEKGNYQFGLKIDGAWTSNGSAFIRTNKVHEIVAGSSGNCTFNADADGDYTFTWTYATNSLEITYPAKVEFDGLADSYFVNDNVTFNATSEGVENPTYTYYVKKGAGEFGGAVSSYTFDEAGTYTVKVEVRENGAGDAKATATQTVTVEEPLTLYFVNKDGWADVNIYFFDPQKTGWPGDPMTATGEETDRNHYAVYSYTVSAATYGSANVIFNNGSGAQTGDLSVNEKHYYYDGDWYATLAECDQPVLTTNFYLAGSFNGWSMTADRFMKATEDAETASVTINVSEYSNITFKVIDDGAWCGSSDAITKDAPSATIAAAGEGGNVAMTPYAAGDYIFTLKLDDSRLLTVTYPDGEQMPIPQNIFLVGQMNNWEENDAYKFAVSGDVATLKVTTLEEMTDYTFKIKYNGAWLGANYEFNYYWCSDVAFSSTENSDATLHTFKEGKYTFTYNLTSGELSIAYPATSATNIEVGQYEYATLYSETAFDVPADVEAYVISDLDGIKLVTEPIYRIPANTGVLLHAPQGSYPFYEGDGRYMDAPASNLLKGTIADETIDNALVHYILTLNDENKVGLFWPYGTGATYGVGAFENKAGKAYLEIPAASQPASVVARRGFLLGPGANIPTGIDNIQESTNNSQKQIINGQLFIFRDGHMFNAQGVRVQ